MSISSSDGTVTTSISVHFSQFSTLDFEPSKMKNQDRWEQKKFDDDAFEKELRKFD